MATRKVDIGPVGRTVASNVTRYRKRVGLTMRDLADDLQRNHWPLSASAISQIENGARRVDVDDLLALSYALGVAPNLLLMPEAHDADESVEGAQGTTTAKSAWSWLLLPPPPSDPISEWWEDPRETGLGPMLRTVAKLSDGPDQALVWEAFMGFVNQISSLSKDHNGNH